ncbi:MAG: hypothetical protein K6F46_04230 [Desulfovibrio sp.]|nr:hypothetical protein [Desulfovibrio sp.]
MLIEEIFNKRIIPFPKQAWQNERGNPDAEKFLLCLTGAAMLFPRDYERFAGYVARELRELTWSGETEVSILWEQLKAGYSDFQEDDAMGNLQLEIQRISNVESDIHNKEEQLDRHNLRLQRDFFGSQAAFLDSICHVGFKERGKGSIEELIMQGMICGYICLVMSTSGQSLKDSIKSSIDKFQEWRQQSDNIRNLMPTLDEKNLNNMIWPKFRHIAWLCSGFSFEFPPHDEQRLILEETQFFRNPLANALNVHCGGWWGFFDFAITIFKRLYEKNKLHRKNDSIP